MNATKFYVSTTRLVLQAEPDLPSSWQDLYTALPTLRNSLSCTVCENLLTEPYTPEETTCEHHVCKGCKGGTKVLRPTCSWCKDYSKYSENVQLRILIQNYKKLCGLVKITKMYEHLLRGGEQGSLLRDIILESEGERIQKPLLVENLRPTPVKVEVKREVEEVREELEPVDEIISSPYSILKARPVAAPSLARAAIKVDLDNRFGETQPTPKASPAPSPPSTSPPTAPTPTSPLTSTSPPTAPTPISPLTSTSPPTAPTSAPRASGGIRKIKAEAFILNPLKGKADLPQLRRLESASKTAKPSLEAASKQESVQTSPAGPSPQGKAPDRPNLETSKEDLPRTKQETPQTKQTLLSDYGISSIPRPEERRRSSGSSEGPAAKRRAGCRCGNATQWPGKLTCCGQRCPCYVEALACTDCRCRGCRNPHLPGGGKARPGLPYPHTLQVVYPLARDQRATVRIPVSLANTQPINLKGLDLTNLPILNLEPAASSSGSVSVSVSLSNTPLGKGRKA